jgi:hypothetical protein
MPHVTTRKVFVTAQVTLPFVSLIISKLLLADVFMHVQDFSNLLGGGLVGFIPAVHEAWRQPTDDGGGDAATVDGEIDRWTLGQEKGANNQICRGNSKS